MKCNQYRPGFELVSPCPFPTTITITPRAPLSFNKKKEIAIWYILVSADQRVKIKEIKKIKYLNFAKELKKLWNMKVTAIVIIVGGLEAAPKSLEKKRLEELAIKRKTKTNQTNTSPRSA